MINGKNTFGEFPIVVSCHVLYATLSVLMEKLGIRTYLHIRRNLTAHEFGTFEDANGLCPPNKL